MRRLSGGLTSQSLSHFSHLAERSGGAKRRVEKTTQSDKVTLTQLSAPCLRARAVGGPAGEEEEEEEEEEEWPLIEIEFTQLQVFIGVLLLPPRARAR